MTVQHNGWKLVEYNSDSTNWNTPANGISIHPDELKGAIGITISDRPKRNIFHKLTTLATKFTHYLRNLEKDIFHNGKSPIKDTLDPNKTTHAFVIVKSKEADVVQVSDADDPGVLRHDYLFSRVLDNKANETKGYYTKIAVVIPPKEIRDRVAKFSKPCSSSLELGNLLSDIGYLEYKAGKLESKIKKATKELKALERKAKRNPRSERAQEAPLHKRRDIVLWQDQIKEIKAEIAPLAQKAQTYDIKNVAQYNDRGLNVVAFSGKIPFWSTIPFIHKIGHFARKRIQRLTVKDYLQVLNGQMITDSKGRIKPMICSEFASKMLKLAKLDVALEKHLAPGELDTLKKKLNACNQVLADENASVMLKLTALDIKKQLTKEYAVKIQKVIDKHLRKDKLFEMKDRGIVPGELLTIGQREIVGY